MGERVVEAMMEEAARGGCDDMVGLDLYCEAILRAALEAAELDYRAVRALHDNLNMTVCQKVAATKRARDGIKRLLRAADIKERR